MSNRGNYRGNRARGRGFGYHPSGWTVPHHLKDKFEEFQEAEKKREKQEEYEALAEAMARAMGKPQEEQGKQKKDKKKSKGTTKQETTPTEEESSEEESLAPSPTEKSPKKKPRTTTRMEQLRQQIQEQEEKELAECLESQKVKVAVQRAERLFWENERRKYENKLRLDPDIQDRTGNNLTTPQEDEEEQQTYLQLKQPETLESEPEPSTPTPTKITRARRKSVDQEITDEYLATLAGPCTTQEEARRNLQELFKGKSGLSHLKHWAQHTGHPAVLTLKLGLNIATAAVMAYHKQQQDAEFYKNLQSSQLLQE